MMNKEELIESTKAISKINHDVEIKIDLESNHRCLICNKEVTSFCKSHSIPYSVFNHMDLENGEIIPFYNAVRKEIMTKVEKGKTNSGIFKLICNECDQTYFSKLDNFDVINGVWDNELLNLQAKRINLYQIYRLKEHSYSVYELLKGVLTDKQINDDKKGVKEELKFFNDLFYKYDTKKVKFKLLLDTVLDYEVDFACVTILPIFYNPCLDYMIAKDRCDIMKIESHDLGNDNFFSIIHMAKDQNNYMYLAILPYDGKTRITLFCDNDSIANIIVKVDFDQISLDAQLLYVSSTLAICGKNMYGNKKFMEKYRLASNIFKRRFFEKYNGKEYPLNTVFDIKESYLYLYDSKINLLKKDN